MKLRDHLIRTTAAWVLFLGFCAATRPASLPAILFIVPFVLLFAALYSTWCLVGAAYLQFLTDREPDRVPHRRLGSVLCLCVMLFLALQSLGQLTLRDIITV